MDENKFRFLKNNIRFFEDCPFLLIDDDNLIKKNKYYIEYDDDKSIQTKILNKFKDIRKSYAIMLQILTDNYYKYDIPNIKKYCTLLLIDDYDHSKIFISGKNMYYIKYNDDDDDNCDKSVYYEILNDFERLVSVKNNIVNLIINDNQRHNITLLVDDFNIFICTNVYQIDSNGDY